MPVAVLEEAAQFGWRLGEGTGRSWGRISQGIASWTAGLGMGKDVVEGRIPDLIS